MATSINGGTTWSTQTVDAAGNTGFSNAIDAVDANNIFISYLENAVALKVAKSANGGSTWAITSIESNSGSTGTSIQAVDANNIFVGYYTGGGSGNLRFSRSVNGGASYTNNTISVEANANGMDIYALDANTVYFAYREGAVDKQKFAVGINGLNIVSVTPSQNAVDVLQSANIDIVFDELINGATVLPSTLPIYGSKGLLPGTYNVIGSTVSFNPQVDFKIGEKIKVVVSTSVESATGLSLPNGFASEFIVEATAGNASFPFRRDLTVGSASVVMLPGDFDNDGDVDLAAPNQSGSNVAVLLNNGDGTFATSVNYNSGLFIGGGGGDS